MTDVIYCAVDGWGSTAFLVNIRVNFVSDCSSVMSGWPESKVKRITLARTNWRRPFWMYTVNMAIPVVVSFIMFLNYDKPLWVYEGIPDHLQAELQCRCSCWPPYLPSIVHVGRANLNWVKLWSGGRLLPISPIPLAGSILRLLQLRKWK